jgi:DME family drug/metabolite transporter
VTAGRSGALLVVVAAASWGTNGTARELLAEDAPPVAVGAMRLAVGGVLLLLWRRPPVGRGAWPRLPLLLAVAAMAAYQPLFFSGIDRAGVAVGTVVGIGSSPVFGGLLGRVVRHERLGARWWAATALGVVGAVLLAVGGGDEAGDDVVLGLLLACGAGVAYAVYVAASASLLDRGDPTDVAAVVLGLAGVVLVPVAIGAGAGWAAEPGGVALAAWLGVVTVALAYPLLARGLDAVGVGATATLTLAEPATAAALGLVVLGEDLSAAGWAGLALVAAGVAVEAIARTPLRRR